MIISVGTRFFASVQESEYGTGIYIVKVGNVAKRIVINE